MVVIKRHDSKMTQEEDEHIVNKALEYFGDKFAGLTKHLEWEHAHYPHNFGVKWLKEG